MKICWMKVAIFPGLKNAVCTQWCHFGKKKTEEKMVWIQDSN